MKKTILMLISVMFAIFAFASCTNDDENPIADSKTYVLVHGAWQAPYVWDEVKANLESKGNKVIVVELPGHGKDNTPTYQLSIDVYSNKVIESIEKVNEKVILVGHSMAGMVISNVAEKIPGRISKLVYIGAFLPTSGQALVDLAYSDPDSKLVNSLVSSDDKLTLDVTRDSLTYLFINDGTNSVKEKVLANHQAEPAIPFTNKVTLTSENFGTVSKVYIKTLKDIVVSPALQDRMIKSAGIKTVLEVNTSHSPFLSQPKVVSDLLLKI